LIIGAIQVFIFKSDAKNYQKKKKIYNDNNLDFINDYWIKLYSGFREYGVKDTVKLILFKDRMIFEISGDKKEILFRNIEDYRIQTETQLVERASLMKVACFGVFGLGMKGKEKELNKEYCYIKAMHEGEEINIVFDVSIGSNEEIIQELHKLIKEYKGLNDNGIVITGDM
ncbi:MAG: hypothetical protein ACRC1T_04880, partial [Clostridium chrysemydis]|uniref:hypothetical protein n=1 Tax=Clostridium chrysemydis TaxID=2665504 RepID=UPI003F387F37